MNIVNFNYEGVFHNYNYDMRKIDSLNNKNIKFYKKLLENKRSRDDSNKFVCESIKVISELINAKITIYELFIREDLFDKLESKFKKTNIKNIFIINKKISEKMSIFPSDSGIYAICEKKQKNSWSFNKRGNYLLIDGIQDFGNLGAIIRTALAFNFNAIYIINNSIDIYNPKIIRYAMGSVFKIDICLINDVKEFINFAKNNHVYIYATTLRDNNVENLNQIKFDKKTNLLIIGNEGKGISNELIKLSNKLIKIPFSGDIDSFNVAVAFGIIGWEMSKYIS